jgi:hypothetical protein
VAALSGWSGGSSNGRTGAAWLFGRRVSMGGNALFSAVPLLVAFLETIMDFKMSVDRVLLCLGGWATACAVADGAIGDDAKEEQEGRDGKIDQNPR